MDTWVVIVAIGMLMVVTSCIATGDFSKAWTHLLIGVGSLVLMQVTLCPLFGLVILFWLFDIVNWG